MLVRRSVTLPSKQPQQQRDQLREGYETHAQRTHQPVKAGARHVKVRRRGVVVDDFFPEKPNAPEEKGGGGHAPRELVRLPDRVRDASVQDQVLDPEEAATPPRPPLLCRPRAALVEDDPPSSYDQPSAQEGVPYPVTVGNRRLVSQGHRRTEGDVRGHEDARAVRLDHQA